MGPNAVTAPAAARYNLDTPCTALTCFKTGTGPEGVRLERTEGFYANSAVAVFLKYPFKTHKLLVIAIEYGGAMGLARPLLNAVRAVREGQ